MFANRVLKDGWEEMAGSNSLALIELEGKVVFKVHPSANKIEIKNEVERMFDVKVKDVKTTNMKGKRKRAGRSFGVTDSWKKAYVTLSEGEINFTDEL